MLLESQYAESVALSREPLGLMANEAWLNDPKRLVFMLARYKFVAKMLAGKPRVIEIGAADGWASRIVQQHVAQLTVSDADQSFVQMARQVTGEWTRPVVQWNPVEGPAQLQYDAAYALDVLEHVSPNMEGRFFEHVCDSLLDDGVFIVGMPSIESQRYASWQSRAGHVNCKTGKALESVMSCYFKNTFLFGMNDEVVHTGFPEMCHYLMCIGAGVRRED